MMSTAAKRPPIFLNKLHQATTKKTKSGIFLFEKFLNQAEAKEAFEVMNNDNKFPWDLKPKLYREQQPQHAYAYTRASCNKEKKLEGVQTLESISQKVEQELDVNISTVFCNRFQDPTHHIPWHTDTFGGHIIVLSLGSTRTVQFRDLGGDGEVEDVVPQPGDLYFMPLAVNSSHEHRVLAVNEGEDKDDGTRLSLLFLCDTPDYAKDYKITLGEKVQGFFEGIRAVI